MAKRVGLEACSPLTIAEVDEGIQKHRVAIIRLQRLRNSIVPIARLPPEVLSTIFLFNVLDKKSTFAYMFEPIPSQKSSHCWINITFVCHYWREVALHNPKLWSFWGRLTSRWSEEFISRSKAAPLHVRLYYPLLPTLHRIFGNSDVRNRIHELHVDMDARSIAALVGHFDEYSASADSTGPPLPIRSLRIRGASYFPSRTLEWPKKFLSCNFPHLWRLELVGCDVDWDSPIFISSVLTRLTIHQVSISTPPAMLQPMSILEKQSRLEKLDFAFGHNPFPDGVVPHVHLPCLRKLQLSGPLLYCFDLATHLSYPRASTVVNFHVLLGSESVLSNPSADPDANFEHRILNFLSGHYGSRDGENSSGNMDLPKILRLSLKVEHSRYEVGLWPNTGLNDPSPLTSSSCHVEVKWQWSERILERFYAMSMVLCATLPLAHLRKLAVVGINVKARGWSDAFKAMDKLEELEVGGDMNGDVTVVAVIDALRPRARTKGSDGGEADMNASRSVVSDVNTKPSTKGKRRRRQAASHVPLPNLTRLHIRDANFNAFEASASDFSSCLRARAKARRGLSLLVLRRCKNLSYSDVETYVQKKFAVVVDWDEDEDFDDDGSDEDDYSNEDEEFDEEDYYYSIYCECC